MVHVEQEMNIAGQITRYEGAMTVSSDAQSTKVGVTATTPAGASEVRVVDGVIYMNLGELSGNMFFVFDGTMAGFENPGAIIKLFDPKTQITTF